MSLPERVLAGDRLALAKVLTLIENGSAEGLETLSALFPHTGRAYLVGITGAPGTGKSTLVNCLARRLRASGEATVAVVAVDPSSPFTGGAILGDRIRMRDLAGDPGIFIRSMASRGALGGLARSTAAVVEAMDAAGFNWILIETVGAGQAEVEIARTAHTTIVVESPSLGDDVQAIKAGILEAADLIVVNKADLPGAENTLRALQSALDMASGSRHDWLHHGEVEHVVPADVSPQGWVPALLKTVATRGEGVELLVDALGRHRTYLQGTGERKARDGERLRTEFETLLRDSLADRFWTAQPAGRIQASLDRVLARELSPRAAVEQLLDQGDASRASVARAQNRKS